MHIESSALLHMREQSFVQELHLRKCVNVCRPVSNPNKRNLRQIGVFLQNTNLKLPRVCPLSYQTAILISN